MNNHQQQREHEAQLAGGQCQCLTDDGPLGRDGFRRPHLAGWRGLQPPLLQQPTLPLAARVGLPRLPVAAAPDDFMQVILQQDHHGRSWIVPIGECREGDAATPRPGPGRGD
jgi:hypothetical protein